MTSNSKLATQYDILSHFDDLGLLKPEYGFETGVGITEGQKYVYIYADRSSPLTLRQRFPNTMELASGEQVIIEIKQKMTPLERQRMDRKARI